MKIHMIVATLVAAQVSLVASPVFAEQPLSTTVSVPLAVPQPSPSEPNVGAALSPLKKNQSAPFSGVLVSPAGVAAMIAELTSTKALVKIEVDKVRADEQARATFQLNETRARAEADQKISGAQLEARDQQINMLTTQLKKAEENRSNAPLWTAIGAGAGVVVTVLTVVAVSQLSK